MEKYIAAFYLLFTYNKIARRINIILLASALKYINLISCQNMHKTCIQV